MVIFYLITCFEYGSLASDSCHIVVRFRAWQTLFWRILQSIVLWSWSLWNSLQISYHFIDASARNKVHNGPLSLCFWNLWSMDGLWLVTTSAHFFAFELGECWKVFFYPKFVTLCVIYIIPRLGVNPLRSSFSLLVTSELFSYKFLVKVMAVQSSGTVGNNIFSFWNRSLKS